MFTRAECTADLCYVCSLYKILEVSGMFTGKFYYNLTNKLIICSPPAAEDTCSPWHVCKGPHRFRWWCFWSRWSHSVSEGPLVGRIWLQTGAVGNSTARQNEAQDSGLEMLILALSLSRLWLSLSYLHNFSVAYMQGFSASTVQILHDQLKDTRLFSVYGTI